MVFKPMMTGISTGMTAGAIAYSLSKATNRQKRKLKNRAGKALKSVSDFIDDISDMLH
ncbi:MAG: hypothetical protein IJ806_11445 [Ruminococcus sp.]|nr:hypothetical protein [Ruminococcus sp.]